MKRIEKLSDNTISELQSLVGEIGNLYRAYIHVSEHMPKGVKTQLDKFIYELDKEIEEREFQY